MDLSLEDGYSGDSSGSSRASPVRPGPRAQSSRGLGQVHLGAGATKALARVRAHEHVNMFSRIST